jgi:hypothetical protein
MKVDWHTPGPSLIPGAREYGSSQPDLASGRCEDFVGRSEELIVDAVRPHPGQRQSADESSQERSWAAQVVARLVQRRVGPEPLDADQSLLIIVLALTVLRPRLDIEGGWSRARPGPVFGRGPTIREALMIVSLRTRIYDGPVHREEGKSL